MTTTTVTTAQIGYRIGKTLGGATHPNTTEVADFISYANKYVTMRFGTLISQDACDIAVTEIVVNIIGEYMKWYMGSGADSANTPSGVFSFVIKNLIPQWVVEMCSGDKNVSLVVVGSAREE